MAEALGHASLDVAMAYVGTFIPGLVIFRHLGTAEQRERDICSGLLEGEYLIVVDRDLRARRRVGRRRAAPPSTVATTSRTGQSVVYGAWSAGSPPTC